MNHGLARVIDAWWGWMAPMAWQVAVLVAALLGLSWLLRKRSARLRYALWLLVPLRLMLPPTLSLVTGWAWWVLPATPPAPAKVEVAAIAPVPLVRPAEPPVRMVPERSPMVGPVSLDPGPAVRMDIEPRLPATAEAAVPRPVIRWREPLFFCWAVVAFLLGLRLLAGWAKAVQMVRRSEPWDMAVAAASRSGAVECGGKRATRAPRRFLRQQSGVDVASLLCRRTPRGPCARLRTKHVEYTKDLIYKCGGLTPLDCNLPRTVRVRTLAGIPTPMLIGMWSPTILLPAGIEDRLSPEELDAVLAHELQHVARRDAVVQLFQAVAAVLYWFHPLVWLSNRWIDRLREDACDEATVAALDNRRQAYGGGLVKVAELASGKRPILALGIAEPGSPVKRRLARILDPRLPVGRRLSRPALAALVLLAAVLLPSAARRAVAEADAAEEPEIRRGSDPMPDLVDAPHGVHRLTFTVVDAETGEAVPDADVRHYDNLLEQPPTRLTDEHGRYQLIVPTPDEAVMAEYEQFFVDFSHSNYASVGMAWTSPNGHVPERLPGDVRVELESGGSIGGVVLDEAGQPLSGVRVLLRGNGYSGYSPSQSFREHRYPDVLEQDPEEPAAVTDDQGRWTFDRFPRDLGRLEIMFIRPDDSRETYVIRNDSYDAYPVLPLDELLSGTATATLKDGIRVRGVVVDEDGRPVPGATVRESYGVQNGGVQNAARTSTFATDDKGRFERTNRAPREWVYTATAPGRATVSEVVHVQENMPEIRIVMPPAQPMTIHAVDESGQPVAGAEILIAPGRNQGQLLEWKARTDNTGTAVWTNAPIQPVKLWAWVKPGGGVRQIQGKAGDDVTVTLSADSVLEQVFVDIHATDADTGEPVTVDSVAVSSDAMRGYQPVAISDADTCRVVVRRSDSPQKNAYRYRLRVRAEGYEPYTSDWFEFIAGDQRLEANMVRGTPVEGVVRLADGTPVAGASVWAPPDAGETDARVLLYDHRVYDTEQMFAVTTAENGRFTLPIISGDVPVVVKHDLGFADVMLSEVRTSATIVLQPYGRIEGGLLVNGQPAPDQRLSLNRLGSWSSRHFRLSYGGQTDEKGQFVFEQVPAGEYKLVRYVQFADQDNLEQTHQVPVVVAAGETLQVEYGPGGRTVTGVVVSDPPGLRVDWNSGRHVLARKVPSVPDVRRDDFVTSSAYATALNKAQEQAALFEREESTYALTFDPSGEFFVHDVPPGEYQLTIQVTRPPAPGARRYQVRPQDNLGEVVQDVIVPPGTEPFDLGEVVVLMTGLLEPPAGGKKMLAYQTPDGVTHELQELRGRPVVVAFWADWSKRSQAAVAALRQRRQEIVEDGDATFLSVCLDGDPASVQPGAVGEDGRWTDAALAGPERLRALDAFEITTLPGIFVLDAEGRVYRRDLGPDRVAEAVRLVRMRMAKQEKGGAQ